MSFICSSLINLHVKQASAAMVNRAVTPGFNQLAVLLWQEAPRKNQDISIKMKKETDEYAEFMLRQYRLVDAYWFLSVEKKYGLSSAVEMNEEVWEHLSAKTAREIKRRFGIDKKGLDGLVKALSYYPWTRITGYEIKKDAGKITLTVAHCPPQEGRIKSGLGEFPCKKMHIKDFSAFAKEIDERIEIRCVHAPPDEHLKERFCEWVFTLRK
jgi:hypothetical protein